MGRIDCEVSTPKFTIYPLFWTTFMLERERLHVYKGELSLKDVCDKGQSFVFWKPRSLRASRKLPVLNCCVSIAITVYMGLHKGSRVKIKVVANRYLYTINCFRMADMSDDFKAYLA